MVGDNILVEDLELFSTLAVEYEAGISVVSQYHFAWSQFPAERHKSRRQRTTGLYYGSTYSSLEIAGKAPGLPPK